MRHMRGAILQGIFEAVERFMVRWHEQEAKKSRRRHAPTVEWQVGGEGH